MTFEGARRGVTLAAEDLLPGRTHHLEGADPAAWRTGVSAYRKVRYSEIYPGIDLVFYGNGKMLEYDYVLRPGADPASIRMRISGADKVRIDAAGDLVLGTGEQDVRWKRPVIYQPGEQSRSVEGRFALDNRGLVRFQVGPYDRSRELVIDPVLAYSTYLGGTGNEAIRAVAADNAGNVFVAGITTTPSLPVSHAVQPAYGGNTTALINGDAFVAKFNSTGALVYLTYLGGSGDDFATGIALDSAGNAWVTGGTSSSNFPVSAAAFQRTYGGAGGNGLMRMGDAFLSKIGPNGDALLYSTYLGGSLDDVGTAVTLDSAGNIYVTGSTRSRNFPVLQPLQAEFAGAGGEQEFPKYEVVPFDAGDAFITKFAAANQAMVYSTYLGGRLDDMPTTIAVDSAGSAYIAGHTLSTDFPTTTGAYQRVNRGSNLDENIFWNFGDAFIAKLNPAGNQLVYSTLLGGTGDDFISSIALDSTGAAYVTGATCSTDFPSTVGVYQKSMRGPSSAPVADVLIGDAFLAKLNPTGTGLAFSTHLGGTGDDAGTAVRLDALGNVYVAGFTDSNDFPTTADGLQRAFGGRGQQNQNQNYGDGFLVMFDAAGAKLTYSTFFGGLFDDEVMAMALDATGNVYLGGSTVSRNLNTKSAFQPAYGGFNNVSRVHGDGFLTVISGFPTPPPVVTGPSVAGITNAASFGAGVVSPGMIFTLFGKGVGPDAVAGAALAPNGTLATLIAET
ncbi:MAG: SBBP repeat-containing protein, partial [Candidatus Solibacter sp.]